MLKDANFKNFAGVYIVCGFTDLRYGIDSLAAERFHWLMQGFAIDSIIKTVSPSRSA